MCSHYVGERRRAYFKRRFGIDLPLDYEAPPSSSHVYPTQLAPFIRRPPERDSGDDAVPELEVQMGHFGLLPGFAKEVKYGLRTYNARTETVASLASFKNAWAKGRKCIVPVEAFYEPDWRTGKHVPTRFSSADGESLGLAGLWQPWKSPAGQWVNSFCMLTINADDHEMMCHMHRPDPKRPPDMQDKRMVVVLPAAQYTEWLDAPPERSMDFMRQCPAERLMAVADIPMGIRPEA